jgi:methylated-DNA-[protein]-cysteine S-methyltransferase
MAEKMSEVYYTRFESPAGLLLLAGDAKALRQVSFESSKRSTPPKADWKQNRAAFAAVIRQLKAYFRGELKESEAMEV